MGASGKANTRVEAVDVKDDTEDIKKSVNWLGAPIENAEEPRKGLRVSAVSQIAQRKISKPMTSKGESAQKEQEGDSLHHMGHHRPPQVTPRKIIHHKPLSGMRSKSN